MTGMTHQFSSPVNDNIQTFNSTAPVSISLDIVSDCDKRKRDSKPMTQGRKKVLGAFLNKQPNSVKGKDRSVN